MCNNSNFHADHPLSCVNIRIKSYINCAFLVKMTTICFLIIANFMLNYTISLPFCQHLCARFSGGQSNFFAFFGIRHSKTRGRRGASTAKLLFRRPASRRPCYANYTKVRTPIISARPPSRRRRPRRTVPGGRKTVDGLPSKSATAPPSAPPFPFRG